MKFQKICVLGLGYIGLPTASTFATRGVHVVGMDINPSISEDDAIEMLSQHLITRPVFDLAGFEPFLKRIAAAGLPVIAGVFPFESARNAEFVANEVPGVRVPESLMERMRKADGQDAAVAEGIAIAREIASGLRHAVQGIQVSTQTGNIDAALGVLNGLR